MRYLIGLSIIVALIIVIIASVEATAIKVCMHRNSFAYQTGQVN